MAQFVLVHGAFHGGWCWRRVADRLRAAGHDVWAPSLTGLGEREHLATAETGLGTHVADICGLIEAEELEKVILVGHSYGGMVITGVAERVPERLSRLVYLDAIVPKHGQSALDRIGPEFADNMRARMASGGPRPGVPAPVFFGVSAAEDVAWLNRRLRPQPPRCFTEPHYGPDRRAATIPRSYIYCSDPAMGPFDQTVKALGAAPGWTLHVLPTGHDAMISDPAGVAGILLGELPSGG